MWTKGNNKRAASALIISTMMLLSACSLLPKEEEALKPPLMQPVKDTFELYEVKKGNIARTVSGVATFASDQVQSSYFRESGGRMEAIDVRVGDTVKKGDVIARLVNGDIDTRIRQQQLTLQKASIILEQTKVEKRGDVQAIRLKEIDVESAQIQLDLLRDQAKRSTLISEINGIVSFVDPIKQGDAVTAYKTMVTIADPSKMRLSYEFSNLNDLSGIQLQMDVNVTYNKVVYKAKVAQIPTSAPQSDVKAIQDKNAKTIVFAVEGLPSDVKLGAKADFLITVESRENVLIIPKVGLRSYLGREYVQVLEGESRKEIDVEKGIVASTEVEISKGLKEGQKVILNN